MTAPILTEEQIREAARVHGENVSSVKSDQNAAIHDFSAGARFALAAATEREKLWRELLKTEDEIYDAHTGSDFVTTATLDKSEQLRLALGIDKERA